VGPRGGLDKAEKTNSSFPRIISCRPESLPAAPFDMLETIVADLPVACPGNQGLWERCGFPSSFHPYILDVCRKTMSLF
jgi:hypothetical protein